MLKTNDTTAESTTGTTADGTTGAAGAADVGPDEVVRTLLVIADAELAAGPERRHVLNAALELALLAPRVADLEAAQAEALAEHASLTRLLRAFPAQRQGEPRPRAALDEADLLLVRRLEALHLATGLLTAPPARATAH